MGQGELTCYGPWRAGALAYTIVATLVTLSRLADSDISMQM